MSDVDIKDLDFTEAAWDSLYDAVDDTAFLDQDAEIIYKSLKHKLKFISFGDYLKRYIYQKAELTEPFSEVPLKEYQLIIKSAFSDNCTPASFTPTTAKLSALSKNWLTQQTVKRNVVFLLGFGLNMSVDDVNIFLTKALRESEINPKNPFEVICWYCYKNKYNYLKFQKLWDIYNNSHATHQKNTFKYDEGTIGIRNTMFALRDDNALLEYVLTLKSSGNMSRIGVTAKKHFDSLYDEARTLVAEIYNRLEDIEHTEAFFEYQDKIISSERLYDYEKLEKINRFRSEKRLFTKDDITESDIEHIICAAIPTDRHGNLTPSKASKLNEQFAGKRFSRQRIAEILANNTEVTRFDLITLNFFVFSQKTEAYANIKQRYTEFLTTTNQILNECFMGSLYIQNPYECFVLMCILSLDPLGTYADVWELSYKI